MPQLHRTPLALALAFLPVLLSCREGASTAPEQAAPVATTIELSASTVSLTSAGATYQLSATVRDQFGTMLADPSVAWSTSTSAVATVSATGLVTAVENGTATITATSGQVMGTAVVTVTGASAFGLASNGVTVICPDAAVGESGSINGVTYTKRDRAQLQALVASGSAASVALLETSCTTGVSDMSGLFHLAAGLNPDIGTWDVSSVTTLASMFHGATSFNQNIGAWDVSSVTDMESLFHAAPSFNQFIRDWDVSNVTNMSHMFQDASAFNRDISIWDVGSVTDMRHMFDHAVSFERDIRGWDVSRVTNMVSMFREARVFDRALGGWNVGSVTNMDGMFVNAATFNADLSAWCVGNIGLVPNDFDTGATSWVLPRPAWGTCSTR